MTLKPSLINLLDKLFPTKPFMPVIRMQSSFLLKLRIVAAPNYLSEPIFYFMKDKITH